MSSLPRPSGEAVEALAPTGSLRAGINLSNFLLVTGTDETGEPAGVSPDLAAALAENLGVELELVAFASPGELADAAISGAWDIGNIGADPARAEHIAFTSPYSEIEASYLVRANSPIKTIADVDQPGVRVVSKARAAYTLWLERNIERAELIQTNSIDASFESFMDDELEVLAGLKPRLLTDAEKLPGARILDGRFTAVAQAIGTPRDRDAAGIEYLEAFVEATIASGLIARLIDEHGVTGQLAVASMQ